MGNEVTTIHASVSEKCGEMTGEISGLEHLGAFKVAIKGRKLFCYCNLTRRYSRVGSFAVIILSASEWYSELMVELSRKDTITEVSMLASQLTMPREGHFEAAFNIFPT
ncbi:LOW QUALITY PROTEIN: hypothetical protein ACHAWX_002202 [Stephanocyclus meneghinianus]